MKILKYMIMLVVYTTLVFGAGVKVHMYYTGYTENIARDVKELIKQNHNDIQNANAQNLEQVKGILDNYKVKVVEIEVPKIVEKEIYKNVCFDQDGVDFLERYKKESSILIKGKK